MRGSGANADRTGAEVEGFELALRELYLRAPDHELEAVHLELIASAAREAGTRPAGGFVWRAPRLLPGGAWPRRVAAVAVAALGVAAGLAGAALAGVTLPTAVNDVFERVGIELPNQEADESDGASSPGSRDPQREAGAGGGAGPMAPGRDHPPTTGAGPPAASGAPEGGQSQEPPAGAGSPASPGSDAPGAQGGPPPSTPAGPPAGTPSGPPEGTPNGPPADTPSGPPAGAPSGSPHAEAGQPEHPRLDEQIP